MNASLSNFLFFFFSVSIGVTMLVEGTLIMLLKKQITPFPSKILYGLGALLAGPEKSRKQFLGEISSKSRRGYGVVVLVFGLIILISAFAFLINTLL